MNDGRRVTVEIVGASAALPTYPLLPGDLLVPDGTGGYTKECPGVVVGGFRLTPDQEATLEPVRFARLGLSYRVEEVAQVSARRKWARTPPAPGLLASADVVSVTGLSYRQLDYWAHAGLAHPQDDPDMATGRSRWWPLVEVQRLAVMSELVRAGVRPTPAHDLAARAVACAAPTSGYARLDLAQGVHLDVVVPDVVVGADGDAEVVW